MGRKTLYPLVLILAACKLSQCSTPDERFIERAFSSFQYDFRKQYEGSEERNFRYSIFRKRAIRFLAASTKELPDVKQLPYNYFWDQIEYDVFENSESHVQQQIQKMQKNIQFNIETATKLPTKLFFLPTVKDVKKSNALKLNAIESRVEQQFLGYAKNFTHLHLSGEAYLTLSGFVHFLNFMKQSHLVIPALPLLTKEHIYNKIPLLLLSPPLPFPLPSPTHLYQPLSKSLYHQLTSNHLDWRNTGCLTPIRNQKECQSCWAISITTLLEVSLCLQSHIHHLTEKPKAPSSLLRNPLSLLSPLSSLSPLTPLSALSSPPLLSDFQSVDCNLLSGGCTFGSNVPSALHDLHWRQGVCLNEQYPTPPSYYLASRLRCALNDCEKSAALRRAWRVRGTHDDFIAALARGVLLVTIDYLPDMFEGRRGEIARYCDMDNDGFEVGERENVDWAFWESVYREFLGGEAEGRGEEREEDRGGERGEERREMMKKLMSREIRKERVKHAVVLVGYGVEEKTGEAYWLLRNSMGVRWGEDGYFKLRRSSLVDVKNSFYGPCNIYYDAYAVEAHNLMSPAQNFDAYPMDAVPANWASLPFDEKEMSARVSAALTKFDLSPWEQKNERETQEANQPAVRREASLPDERQDASRLEERQDASRPDERQEAGRIYERRDTEERTETQESGERQASMRSDVRHDIEERHELGVRRDMGLAREEGEMIMKKLEEKEVLMQWNLKSEESLHYDLEMGREEKAKSGSIFKKAGGFLMSIKKK